MWQTIRCEGDMVQIHFFTASFFPSYHDSATLMAAMEGAATFVRRSILNISVHMRNLNSMGSLHSPRPGYFSYKLCGQPAELCGVLQTFMYMYVLCVILCNSVIIQFIEMFVADHVCTHNHKEVGES